MVARDDVRRIELEVAEMLDRLQDRAGTGTHSPVEELRADGEAARLGERELIYAEFTLYATGTCGCFSGARSRKFTMSSSDSGDSYDSMRPASASLAISGSIGSFAMSGALEAMTSLRPWDGPKTSIVEPSGTRT